MTSRGKDKHRTCCGGCTALLIYAIMGFYLYVLMMQPLESDKSIITTTTTETTDTADSVDDDDDPVDDDDDDEGDEGDEGDNFTFEGSATFKKTSGSLDNHNDAAVFYPGNTGFQFAATMMVNGLDPQGVYVEFWILYKPPGENFGYIYLESNICTLDQFPADTQATAAYLGVDQIYLCPNLTDFAILGDRYSDEYQYIEIDAVICFEDCYDEETFASMYEYEFLKMVYTEPYFDDTDPYDTVKYRLNYYNDMALDIYSMVERYNIMTPNLVVDFEGDAQEFWTLTPGYVNKFNTQTNYPVIDYYMLGNRFDLYQQYITYSPEYDEARRNLDETSSHQAVIENDGRHLETSESEELMSTEYSLLYILSQLGGLYAILVLILGLFVGHVATKSF
jgi:hypothetical protein